MEAQVLDDAQYIKQIDTGNALEFLAKQPEQLRHVFGFDSAHFQEKNITKAVFSGMGGSSLAAEFMRSWPEITKPFVISKDYRLPSWVDETTLVVVASYSGNTEETLASLDQALEAGAVVAVLAHGGKLLERAVELGLPHAAIPESTQPRTAVLYMYRAAVELFSAAGLVAAGAIEELESVVDSLSRACSEWAASVPTEHNYAKQLAEAMVGKTPIIYGGPLTYPAAYKWKINVNENAKNTAWCSQYPEFNHNEFLGWSSHPIEKPFAVIDLISSFEHPRVLQRFELSDRLLSGKRPKAVRIEAPGSTLLEQLLFLVLLGDFATAYLGILNGIDPSPVELVERFKKELGA